MGTGELTSTRSSRYETLAAPLGGLVETLEGSKIPYSKQTNRTKLHFGTGTKVVPSIRGEGGVGYGGDEAEKDNLRSGKYNDAERDSQATIRGRR